VTGDGTGAWVGGDSARAEVLAAAAACVRAFGSHDTAAYFACFDPAATFLFHTTDRLLGSRAEYEAEWASWEAEGFRVLSCGSSEQRVDLIESIGALGALGSVAVFTHRVRTEVRPATGADPEVTHERETIVWRRGPDGWLAVHEHLSPDPAA
jgi:ketosteroid isomerase-like protein